MAFSVSWTYQILDRYTGPLKKIQKQTARTTKAIGRAQKAVGNFSSKMAGAQSGIASFAGVLGGGLVLNTVNQFETSMNKLGAVALANDETMGRFRETAKTLGETTQFSASQVADGMVFLKMAGLDANKVMEAIPGTLQLAAAGGIELAAAADIATNVLAQMGLEVKDLNRVNDVLATVQSNANTDIMQAAEAMKNLGTTSSSLGVSIEQTTALIGAMANAGVKGGEAGTLLRNAMLKLVNPSKKAQHTFRRLGINMKEFVTPEGRIKNFSKLIGVLSEKGATTAQIFTMFEERGGRAIQALQKIGTPAIDSLTSALEKGGGAAEKMANIQMRGLPGIIKTMASAWEAVQIALFESGLADLLVKMFGRITKLFRSIVKTNPALLKLAGIAGLVAIALGPLLMMIGFIGTGVSTLMGVLVALGTVFSAISIPIVLVAGIVGVLVAAIARAWAKNEKLRESFGTLLKSLSPLIKLFKALWDMIAGPAATKALELFEKLADIVGVVLVKAFDSLASVMDIVLSPLEGLIDKFGLGEGPGVAAQGANAMQGNINGSIDVTASGGAKVNNAKMTTDLPGNLGMNMAGAG
jgi:TP901 family phage tail tape measure protein